MIEHDRTSGFDYVHVYCTRRNHWFNKLIDSVRHLSILRRSGTVYAICITLHITLLFAGSLNDAIDNTLDDTNCSITLSTPLLYNKSN